MVRQCTSRLNCIKGGAKLRYPRSAQGKQARWAQPLFAASVVYLCSRFHVCVRTLLQFLLLRIVCMQAPVYVSRARYMRGPAPCWKTWPEAMSVSCIFLVFKSASLFQFSGAYTVTSIAKNTGYLAAKHKEAALRSHARPTSYHDLNCNGHTA